MDKKLIRLKRNRVENLSFNEVLKQYEGLLVKLCAKWKGRWEFDDLFQMASLGLWDAYKYHDHNNGNTFGTLAHKTIIFYLNWHRQNNADKSKNITSKISDICSYDCKEGFKDTFMDNNTLDDFQNVEYKVLMDKVYEKLKQDNFKLTPKQRKLAVRNLMFTKLVGDGFSVSKIAKLYNLNRSTVNRGLDKAYARIKEILKAEKMKDILEG